MDPTIPAFRTTALPMGAATTLGETQTMPGVTSAEGCLGSSESADTPPANRSPDGGARKAGLGMMVGRSRTFSVSLNGRVISVESPSTKRPLPLGSILGSRISLHPLTRIPRTAINKRNQTAGSLSIDERIWLCRSEIVLKA